MTTPPRRQTILIVDDSPANIAFLGNVLKDGYDLKVATNGYQALQIAQHTPEIGLILLDIIMPGMDGYEVCRHLKASKVTERIPVVFVSARADIDDEALGFAVGAVDYITKPIRSAIVKARVRTHLALFDQNQVLEEMVRKRTEELAITQDVTILSLATLAEYRDNETGGHIVRTQRYVRVLAENLRHRSRFRDGLNPEAIDLLFKSATLHDIGKVGIADRILRKPGPLTPEDFKEMKRHPGYGAAALARAEQLLGTDKSSSFLHLAREIAISHHEKWDGSGYPDGLAGDEIPVPGRLMAMADIYDAMVSRRIYKPPFSHQKAYEIIVNGDGRVMPYHFDPGVLETFINHHETFRAIAAECADSEEERQALDGYPETAP